MFVAVMETGSFTAAARLRTSSGQASKLVSRLTAPLTFGTREVAPALNDFARRFLDIELDVSFSDRVVNLVDEGFDLAVRVGKPDDSSMIARKPCDMRIVVVGAPAYLDGGSKLPIPSL